MMTVATFFLVEEAHLLRMRLGSAGIEAYVPDETVMQVDPMLAYTGSGIRVQVADEDHAAAMEILAAQDAASDEAP